MFMPHVIVLDGNNHFAIFAMFVTCSVPHSAHARQYTCTAIVSNDPLVWRMEQKVKLVDVAPVRQGACRSVHAAAACPIVAANQVCEMAGATL